MPSHGKKRRICGFLVVFIMRLIEKHDATIRKAACDYSKSGMRLLARNIKLYAKEINTAKTIQEFFFSSSVLFVCRYSEVVGSCLF